MAVMKTFCGCCSTKTGVLTILGFNLLMYAGGIILSAFKLAYPDDVWVGDMEVPKECYKNSTSEFKDSWWCTSLNDAGTVENDVAIGKLVFDVVLLIFSIIAIYGTTSDKSCPILPAIIGEFVLWMTEFLIAVAVVLILTVYQPGDIDMTTSVSIALLLAIVLVFLLYLWLCLVSHFQILREIEGLGKDEVKVMQYPYDKEKGDPMDPLDPHYGDIPTDRTGISPPPEYSPPDDPPEIEDIHLDAKLE